MVGAVAVVVVVVIVRVVVVATVLMLDSGSRWVFHGERSGKSVSARMRRNDPDDGSGINKPITINRWRNRIRVFQIPQTTDYIRNTRTKFHKSYRLHTAWIIPAVFSPRTGCDIGAAWVEIARGAYTHELKN